MKRKSCPIIVWIQKRSTNRAVVQESSRKFNPKVSQNPKVGQVVGRAASLTTGQDLTQLACQEDRQSSTKALMVGLIPVATGVIFSRAFDLGWEAITKRETPRPQDSSSLPLLIVFTVASSVTLAVAQRLIFRGAQKYFQK